MIHDAYMERYQKPTYKFPIIIFIAIVAVSVFLSMQIKKTKDNTNIAAFNYPVPLDSIAVNVSSPLQSNDIAHRRELLRQEQAGITPNSIKTEPDGFDQEALHASNDSDIPVSISRGYVASTLDEVYNKQQDKFLQTLAKRADVEQQAAMANNEKKKKSPVKTNQHDGEKTVPKPTLVRETPRVAKPPEVLRVSLNQTVQAKPQTVALNAPVTNPEQVVALRPEKTVSDTASSVSTELELERFLSRFTYFYNSGDINRLMALFADNASTNDSRGKRNIKADYIDLFNNTHARRLMINQVKWQVNNNNATGAGDFIVTVLNKNNRERHSIKGKLTITAIKQSQGYYISTLLHDLN
ncbi:MAG: hypothetical protein GXP08_03630 [Gammaproteobacteria bacterium]|nr:hypothetical protein [Gammaproteobacteria bacterium]